MPATTSNVRKHGHPSVSDYLRLRGGKATVTAALSVTQLETDNVDNVVAGTGWGTGKTCAMRGVMRAPARVRLAGPGGNWPLLNVPPCPMKPGSPPLSMRLELHYSPRCRGGPRDFDGGGVGRDARRADLSLIHSVRRNLSTMPRHSSGSSERRDVGISRRKKRRAAPEMAMPERTQSAVSPRGSA